MTNEEQTGTWWVGKDRNEFYQTVRDRADELARKYGSAPVSTVPSKLEQTFMDKVAKKVRSV
jgi:acyl-homoserine lactone acylase PvdQ